MIDLVPYFARRKEFLFDVLMGKSGNIIKKTELWETWNWGLACDGWVATGQWGVADPAPGILFVFLQWFWSPVTSARLYWIAKSEARS